MNANNISARLQWAKEIDHLTFCRVVSGLNVDKKTFLHGRIFVSSQKRERSRGGLLVWIMCKQTHDSKFNAKCVTQRFKLNAFSYSFPGTLLWQREADKKTCSGCALWFARNNVLCHHETDNRDYATLSGYANWTFQQLSLVSKSNTT